MRGTWTCALVLGFSHTAFGFINVMPNASWFLKKSLFLSQKVDGYSAALFSAFDSFSGTDSLTVGRLSGDRPSRWVATMSALSSSPALDPGRSKDVNGIPGEHYAQVTIHLDNMFSFNTELLS
jgi:hypothetical protein